MADHHADVPAVLPGAPAPAPAPATPAPAPSEAAPAPVIPSDWMASIDARIDALGRAVHALLGADVAALGGGTATPPPAAPPSAPATVQAVGQVATEAAAKAKRKVGLLW